MREQEVVLSNSLSRLFTDDGETYRAARTTEIINDFNCEGVAYDFGFELDLLKKSKNGKLQGIGIGEWRYSCS